MNEASVTFMDGPDYWDPKWVETGWNMLKPLSRCISDYFRIQALRHPVAGKPVKALSRWTFAERGLWSISGGWNSAPNLQRWNRDNELRRWTTKTPQVLKQVGYGWIAAEKLLCNILQLLPSASICQHLLPPVYIIPAIPLCHVFQNNCAPPNAQQWELLFTLQLLCLLLPLFWHPGGCCSEIHCEKFARNNIQQTNTSRI